MNEYSQGICEDGAAILKNGQMMTIEEIVAELQERDQLKEKLEIATGALNHYLYGGSDYSQVARDALEKIKGAQHETNT